MSIFDMAVHIGCLKSRFKKTINDLINHFWDETLKLTAPFRLPIQDGNFAIFFASPFCIKGNNKAAGRNMGVML